MFGQAADFTPRLWQQNGNSRSSSIWPLPAAVPLAKLWLLFNRWAHVNNPLLLQAVWLVLIWIIYIYDITVSLSSLFFNGVINRPLLFSPGALSRSQDLENKWKTPERWSDLPLSSVFICCRLHKRTINQWHLSSFQLTTHL